MVTIQYEINGKMIDIEVTEEFAKQYKQIETEEKRVNRKETRRHKSLETLIEVGFQILDPNGDIEEKTLMNEDIKQFRNALKTLTPDQKWLVYQVYFCGRNQIDIAKKIGVDPTAIRNRLRKIYAKLKKFLK